jgi:hypothetical protein
VAQSMRNRAITAEQQLNQRSNLRRR